MSFTQRIAQLEKYYKKKGIKTVYNQMGIAASSFSSLKEKGANPKLSTLVKILEFDKNINARWLLTGEGEMLVESITSNEQKIEQHTKEIISIQEDIAAVKKELASFIEILGGLLEEGGT